MKCISLITREYKTTKADSIYPEYRPNGDIVPNPRVREEMEVCGGQLSVELELDHGSGCTCCGPGPELILKVQCARCKFPYFHGMRGLEDQLIYGSLDITSLLDAAEERR